MDQQREHDVIICGGGPVDMGLAVDLGQRGVRVAVVERYPNPQPVPKGQNLTQRTAEHFRAWGCEAELRTAHPLPEGAGTGGITCYGNLLSDYHYEWLNRSAVGEFYAAGNVRLPQYETEKVLRARVAELDSVQVYYGWSGTAVRQDATGVTLETQEHRGTGRDQLRGTYLIGCDGSKSAVRDAAGITQTRSDHDRQMALVVFRSTQLHDLLARFPGKAFFNALHPNYQGYWQFFGRVDHGESWFFHAPVPMGSGKQDVDFEDFIHNAVGTQFELSIDYVGFWDLRFAIADSYRKGRVFVAGDAAHSHPPYGGYGINIGLEDARNLGWKLAAALGRDDADELLDSYDAERRPVFASTARDFIGNFIEADRDFLASYAPEQDLAEFEAAWSARAAGDPAVMSYEPNYEGSPVIGGDGAPGASGEHVFQARAGHHLAPLPKPGGTTYDALGDGFTLFAQDSEAAEVTEFRNTADALGLSLTIAVGAGAQDLAGYGAAFVLVRPDHFVAWAGDAGDARAILSRAAGISVGAT